MLYKQKKALILKNGENNLGVLILFSSSGGFVVVVLSFFFFFGGPWGKNYIIVTGFPKCFKKYSPLD